MTDKNFISAADGTEQKYIEQLPVPWDSSSSRPVLIALHGHGSDRWQYARDKRAETRAARDIAAKYGMIFISPDYRAPASWMGPAAEADLLQLIQSLRNEYRIGKIILAGGSMGGTAALIFTALHPDLVDGVCAHNANANMESYPNFTDAIAASYGGTAQQLPAEYRRRSPEFFPEKFTMPLALSTGGRDTLVPPESVLRLYEKIKTCNRDSLLVHRPEGGHATDYPDSIRTMEFVVERVLHTSPAAPGMKLW